MKIENALAMASKTPVELRDPEANYHKISIAELEKKAPNLGWTELLDQLGVKQDTVLMGQPGFYSALSGMLHLVPVSDLEKFI
jgi:putative endopeptidase